MATPRHFQSSAPISGPNLREQNSFVIRGYRSIETIRHLWTTMREGIDFIVSYRKINTPRHQYLHVPNGYYNNIGELCEVITDKLDEKVTDQTKPIALRFNKITGRVHLKMMDNYHILCICNVGVDIRYYHLRTWYVLI